MTQPRAAAPAEARIAPWRIVGDVAADLWQSKTAERWTRREHKMFKTAYYDHGGLPVVDAVHPIDAMGALLAWSFDHWDDIVAAEFAFMTRNRPPSRPTATFMCAAANAHKILELYENWLDVPHSLSDKVQSERKSTEWRRERDAEEDRHNEDERWEREQFQEWQKEPEAGAIEELFTLGRTDAARKLIGPQQGNWRGGPRADEVRALLDASVPFDERRKNTAKALKLIYPYTKDWQDGPNANEIMDLFMSGRADEARELIATVEPIEED